jgi:hypothetical protein
MLLLIVFELVRRRRLLEPYAVLWILAAVALIVVSLRRDAIDRMAGWLGVYYPPAALLLGLTLVVFVIGLWFSVIVSRQQRQVERLIEEAAVLAAELRELRKASEQPLEAPDVQRPAPKVPDA